MQKYFSFRFILPQIGAEKARAKTLKRILINLTGKSEVLKFHERSFYFAFAVLEHGKLKSNCFPRIHTPHRIIIATQKTFCAAFSFTSHNFSLSILRLFYCFFVCTRCCPVFSLIQNFSFYIFRTGSLDGCSMIRGEWGDVH